MPRKGHTEEQIVYALRAMGEGACQVEKSSMLRLVRQVTGLLVSQDLHN